MQPITDIIRKTYLDRFDELELPFQFHFVSRLYAWRGDKEAAKRLTKLAPKLLPATHTERLANLQGMGETLAAQDLTRDIRNYERRKPYFEKYPQLLLLHNVIFRIRTWYCLYGIDEREALFQLFPEKQITGLLTDLQKDTKALVTLSTYAINALFLYEKLYPDSLGAFVDPKRLYNLKTQYEYTDPKDLQLLLYLYTHCIICETLFYTHPITARLDTCLAMLKEIEQIIADHFDLINIDNKLEFLVCARLCGFTSGQSSRICQEAADLLTDEGFILDKDKIAKRPELASHAFILSEHTNALFLMSQSTPVFLQRRLPFIHTEI